MTLRLVLPAPRALSLASALAIGLVFGPPLALSAQSTGQMQDLGTLGGDWAFASAVSADGNVVVGHSYTAGGVPHAFRWTGPLGMQDLGTLLGGLHSWASGVSADGSVVVGDTYYGPSNVRAFRWSSTQGMQDLGTLEGHDGSSAVDVSSDGTVVVGYSYVSGSQDSLCAFRWTCTDGMQNLGPLLQVTAVSSDGSSVVGAVATSPASGAPQRAFRWTQTHGLEDLGTLGGDYSAATAISADGSVVVGYAAGPGNLFEHAFRWTTISGIQDFGVIGGDLTRATSVSADGMVVVGLYYTGSERGTFRWTPTGGLDDIGGLGHIGYSDASIVSADGTAVAGTSYSSSPPVYDHHAFRWMEDGGLQDLGDLGYGYSEALDISADGRVIVGRSPTVGNPYRAFRWIGCGPDSDGDGICDDWETAPIDINSDGVVELDIVAMGATPDHKDIFVEVDAMWFHQPLPGALEDVVSAFACAPVQNVDMQPGIRLHLDKSFLVEPFIDNTNAWGENPWGDFAAFKALYYANPAERNHPLGAEQWERIRYVRERVFHYCVFGNKSTSPIAGKAEITLQGGAGDDFMVLLGKWNPKYIPLRTMQSRVFMHELGHNLGLQHGGSNGNSPCFNYKPNYHSMMNYLWVFADYPISAYADLDYSREVLPTLDPLNLNEHTGIGAIAPNCTGASHREHFALIGPWDHQPWTDLLVPEGDYASYNGHGPGEIDWNFDGAIEESVSVSWPITFSAEAAQAGCTGLPLTGYKDWTNLLCAFVLSSCFGTVGACGSALALDEDLTYNTYQMLNERWPGWPELHVPILPRGAQVNIVLNKGEPGDTYKIWLLSAEPLESTVPPSRSKVLRIPFSPRLIGSGVLDSTGSASVLFTVSFRSYMRLEFGAEIERGGVTYKSNKVNELVN